jgi:hypothetical protein
MSASNPSSPVKILIALCREVMAAHGDVRSAEYNGCEIDGEACFWCEQARNAIAEIDK